MSIQRCVNVAGESMQRLTPLALVSVVGGASSAAAVRVESGEGFGRRREEVWGADEHMGATRPLPALARPSLSASQLVTKPALPNAPWLAALAGTPSGGERSAREFAGSADTSLPCPVSRLRLLTEDVVAAPGVAASTATPVAVALPATPIAVVLPATPVVDAPVSAVPVVPAPIAAALPATPVAAIAGAPVAVASVVAAPASAVKQPPLAQPAAVPVVPRAVAAPAASAAPQAKRELFRKAALDAHYGTDLEVLAEPKTGAWTVLAVLASLVALLFIGSALSSIEVTVKAPGALRAPNGLRSVESVLSGAVTEVLAQAGDEVEEGQVVARLEETQLESTLTLRERELEVLQADTLEAGRADEALLRSATRALERQRVALARREQINRAQLRQRSAHLQNLRQLVKHGAASAADELQVNESVQAAAESVAVLGSQLAQLDLSLADRKREWQQRDLERRTALSRATAAVEEARSLLELIEIRAPAAGRIESLLATPGAVVQAGEIMAQIVPKDAPRSIVAFLPSRETAFVKLGTEANVEVESLPVNEFGMARASVTRISTDIAKPEEFEAAFGEAMQGSFVRVELSLSSDQTHDKMAPHLRSGERVVVRLHRRERRIISLLFEFVRKWLGQ